MWLQDLRPHFLSSLKPSPPFSPSSKHLVPCLSSTNPLVINISKPPSPSTYPLHPPAPPLPPRCWLRQRVAPQLLQGIEPRPVLQLCICRCCLDTHPSPPATFPRRLPCRIRSSTASRSRRTSSGAVTKKPYLRLPRPPLQASPPPSVSRRPATRQRLSKTFPTLDLYYVVHQSYGISIVRSSTPLASSPPMDILNRRQRSSPLPRSCRLLQPLPRR